MTDRLSYLWRGLRYGALAGLVAAEIYIVVVTLALMAITSSITENLYLPIMGQMYGVFPAIIVGGVAGLLIGLVFALTNRSFNSKSGTLLGFAMASGFTTLAIAVLIVTNSTQIMEWQSALVLLPIALLVLASGAWGGRKLTMSARPRTQDKLGPNPS